MSQGPGQAWGGARGSNGADGESVTGEQGRRCTGESEADAAAMMPGSLRPRWAQREAGLVWTCHRSSFLRPVTGSSHVLPPSPPWVPASPLAPTSAASPWG